MGDDSLNTGAAAATGDSCPSPAALLSTFRFSRRLLLPPSDISLSVSLAHPLARPLLLLLFASRRAGEASDGSPNVSTAFLTVGEKVKFGAAKLHQLEPLLEI